MDIMPVLFIGHGSPMNAIEDNEFTRNWTKISGQLPKPKAVLMVSAHWYTQGTRINDDIKPRMVYDMYGFPDELYSINYPANGAPEAAHLVSEMLSKDVVIDNSWGFDHGNWVVMKYLFPKADIPLFQLSIDYLADMNTHFKLGQELNKLREQGILIIGSGNVVHNLPLYSYDKEGGFEWANEFDTYIRKLILQKDYTSTIEYHKAERASFLAVPTPDHYIPLLYVLGAVDIEDKVSVFNNSCINGSMSMTCYHFSR
jgi:4,5-DOPA dioxygenase extradiol